MEERLLFHTMIQAYLVTHILLVAHLAATIVQVITAVVEEWSVIHAILAAEATHTTHMYQTATIDHPVTGTTRVMEEKSLFHTILVVLATHTLVVAHPAATITVATIDQAAIIDQITATSITRAMEERSLFHTMI